MLIETVPIESIHCDPANARQHNERNISGIAGSLKKFGQQRPIVVGIDGVIVAGNGTYQAALTLGWADIQVVYTNLVGVERAAYAVADNRLSDPDQGSTWDTAALAAILSALQAEDATLVAAAGFTTDELVAFLGDGGEQLPEAPPEFETVDESIQTDHQCPKCGYKWSGGGA